MERFWNEFRADVERAYQRPASLGLTAAAPWIHPGLRAAFLYRMAHRLWRRRPLRILAAVLKRIASITTGAEIHPAARIGGGLHLPHPQGVVIGPAVGIAGSCTIFQDVSLGPRQGGDADGPSLDVHTFVYPGARILGKVRVGARTQVGPNCVVYRDLPEGSTVLPPEPLVLEGLSFGLRFDLQPPAGRRLEAVP